MDRLSDRSAVADAIPAQLASATPVTVSSVRASSQPRHSAAAHATGQLLSFKAWKQFLRDDFPWLQLSEPQTAAFEAAVTSYRVGRNLFCTFRTDAFDAARPRDIETAGAGCTKVMWQLSGRTEIEQDGRACVLDVGQMGVCDTSRPYRMRLSARAELAVLLLPHDAHAGWQESGAGVCACSIDESIATRAALAALMSLNSLPLEVVANEGAPVLTAVKWMLGSILRGAPATAEDDGSCGALMIKARRHIVEHISNPALSPDHVASALCISRRSLYLLFKGHRLTPSKMIHDIRLNQARSSLEDPSRARQKMTSIALDAGFADYATFSRLFKAHFNVTPSEFRLQRRLSLCA